MDMLVVEFTTKEHKRIFKNIVKVGCWEWQGALDSGGYPQGFYRGKKEKVHRLMYALTNGPIPRGLPGGRYNTDAQIDHLCKNIICCNPKHLELVTQRINNLRSDNVSGRAARQTLCIHGHQLKREKTRDRRYCPTCDNLRHKKRMQGPQREYWLEKQRQATARYIAKHR